jgi:hypothetical protein
VHCWFAPLASCSACDRGKAYRLSFVAGDRYSRADGEPHPGLPAKGQTDPKHELPEGGNCFAHDRDSVYCMEDDALSSLPSALSMKAKQAQEEAEIGV